MHLLRGVFTVDGGEGYLAYAGLTGELVAALSAAAFAQNSLIFTGRFPFVSLDAPNEGGSGATTRLEEFDEFIRETGLKM